MSAADEVLLRLDSAPDDTTRQELLAGCPHQVLEQLHAALAYRRFNSTTAERFAAERAAFDAFTSELDAQPDDASRLRIIEVARRDPQRGARLLAEWQFRRTATSDACLRRYQEAIGLDVAP